MNTNTFFEGCRTCKMKYHLLYFYRLPKSFTDEGIFAREFSSTLHNKNYFFLELKINKNECMKRVVQRDLRERGKAKKQAKKDFLNSWDIYYKKFKNKSIKNNTNELIIRKNTNIDQILENIFT